MRTVAQFSLAAARSTKTLKTRLNVSRRFRANLHKPTDSYLELSSHTQPPSRSAKLVILDLNGTLLSRPKTHQHPRLSHSRPVFLRPFMPTICRYLFHQETLSWLDTMVWSSAQPHNVAIMVRSCFGDEQEKLVQVWARDRMDRDIFSAHRFGFLLSKCLIVDAQIRTSRQSKTWT